MRFTCKLFFWTVACVGLVLLASVGAMAQAQLGATGTVLGHIQDSSGAAIPGAKVTLRNEQTGIEAVFTTSSAGDYVFVNQIPDTYQVTVEKTGFKKATTAGLILQVAQTLRQDFTLQVGSATQQVTVSAQASMLQTDNSTIGQVIDQRMISALPLNGRDYTTLIAVNAGVTQPSGGIQVSIFDPHGLNPSWSMSSIDGARPSSISYLIDGFTNNDQLFAKSMSLISADSIQEFKLQNGLYSAAYGTGSAQVTVALKSGTNQLHGTAYDYWRNSALQPDNAIFAALNARNGSHIPVVSPFNQNQFGFTLGGPMVLPKIYNGRNRTFWFVGYEGGRQISGGTAPGFAQLPTAKERSGDFSDWPYPIYNPATSGSVPNDNPAGRAVFPNNQIPSSMINSISQKWLNFFPTPNITCTLPCPNYSKVVKQTVTTDTVNGRLDHQLTTRDRLSGTVIVSRDVPFSPSILPASSSTSFSRTRMVGLDYIRNLTPNSVNDLRAGYNRENFHEGSVTAFGANLSQQLGFLNTNSFPLFYGLPGLSLAGGYSAPGNNNNGYSQKDNIFEYADTYTLIHGKHTLTAGADIRRYRLQDVDGFTINGQTNFTGAFTASDPKAAGRPGPTSGNGFADFLLGYPFSVIPASPEPGEFYDVRSTDWNFFFEDDFRVTPRLTVNLGLRYEIPGALYSPTNDGSVLNLKTPGGGVIWASKSFVAPLQSAPSASTYYQCCVSNQLVPTHFRDFSPRIGLAWRPLPHNDRLVLRAGYGLFYGTYMRFYDAANYTSNALSLIFANPNYPGVTGSEKSSPLALSTLWLPPVTLLPTTIPPPYAFGIQTEWPNNKDPYDQQWTLDAQYQFTPSLMLDMGYVGGHSLNLPYQWHFNEGFLPKTPGDPCNVIKDRSLASAACLADPNFQPIDTRVPFANLSPGSYSNANILWSNYNSLQIRLEKRFSQGLQFNANYTWSRAFDLGSEIAQFGGQIANFIQNAHDLAADYGPAAFDQPQRFALSYLYED
ncbi:MAG: TonB-dependent receptor, partial [Acidobacteriota bacterium]|nr:TonB-dependent receptor [Acidobacteriota bacterium]